MLSLELLQQHHIHIDRAVIIFEYADVAALSYQIISILLDKSRLAGSEEAGNEIYFTIYVLSFLRLHL